MKNPAISPPSIAAGALLSVILFTAVACEPSYPLLGTYEWTEAQRQSVAHPATLSELPSPENGCQSAEVEQRDRSSEFFELDRQERDLGGRLQTALGLMAPSPYRMDKCESIDDCETGVGGFTFDPETLEHDAFGREGSFVPSGSMGRPDMPAHCQWKIRRGSIEPTEDGVRMVHELHMAAETADDESECRNAKDSDLEWTCLSRTVYAGERIDTDE